MSRPKPKGYVSETILRVRYAETDAMGIVHHAAYIPWFEVGRSDWLRDAGFPYTEFEKMGYYLVVAEVGARYYHPAHYDELVTVRTWMGEIQSRAVRIEYEVVNENGDLLVTGFTKHICIDRSNRPRRLPKPLLQAVERRNKSAIED